MTKQNLKIAEEIVESVEKYIKDNYNVKLDDDQR